MRLRLRTAAAIVCLIPCTSHAQFADNNAGLPPAPLAPLNPTDSKACSDFREQLDSWAAEIARQHQYCLDAHSKDEIVPTTSLEGPVCSRSSCQWLHTQMMNSRKRVESDANDCDARVEKYRSARRAEDDRRREEARRAEESHRLEAERREQETERQAAARDAAAREQEKRQAQQESAMRSAEDADRARQEALAATNKLRDQQAEELRDKQEQANSKVGDRLAQSVDKITDAAKSLADAANGLTSDGLKVGAGQPVFDLPSVADGGAPSANLEDGALTLTAGSALDAAARDLEVFDMSPQPEPTSVAGIELTVEEGVPENDTRRSQDWISGETMDRLRTVFESATHNVPVMRDASAEIDAAFGPLEHADVYAFGSLRETSDAAHEDAATREPTEAAKKAMEASKRLTGGSIDALARAWTGDDRPLSDDERLIEGDPSVVLRGLPYLGQIIGAKERADAAIASSQQTAQAIIALTKQAYESAKAARREVKGWVRDQWQQIWAQRPEFDDAIR